jgi:hypothetical protein
MTSEHMNIPSHDEARRELVMMDQSLDSYRARQAGTERRNPTSYSGEIRENTLTEVLLDIARAGGQV